MKRRLKTWEQFVKEFKPLASEWKVSCNYYYIKYNDMKWFISPEMKRIFGTEIEIEKVYSSNYTYIGGSYYWHELWFEEEFKEIEFLSEEEVML